MTEEVSTPGVEPAPVHHVVRSAWLVMMDGEDTLLAAAQAYAREHGVALKEIPLPEFLAYPEKFVQAGDHVVAMVRDEDVGMLIHIAKTLKVSLGLLPGKESRAAGLWFRLPSGTAERVSLAFQNEHRPIDVMRCNDEVVVGMVMLGKTPFLDQRSKTYLNRHGSLWGRVRYGLGLLRVSFRNLLAIRPFPVTLTTGKDVAIKTSVTGLVVIENEVQSAAAKIINNSVSVEDGKISTVLIAPKSVVEYLAFLITAMWYGDRPVKRLPRAVSYLKTSKLNLAISGRSVTYYVDGHRREAEAIQLEMFPRAVNMNLSEAYLSQLGSGAEDKDTMRMENLPEHEDRVAMLTSHLPFFTRALEDDFKDLFIQLREASTIRAEYVTLMLLSTVVASLGMFLNSIAVIIGAMVLAPLMAPIISLAMGLLRAERGMIRASLAKIGFGVALGLMAAAALSFLIPLARATSEIMARVQPTLLDLGVAVASGVAGAYAYSRESVAKSLPGVAIAVALVPPLCVVGIGIGWADWAMVGGASLLLFTNLVGISLSAALTFLVLGYAPILKARRGLTITLMLVLVIAVPLSYSFYKIHVNWSIERELAAQVYVVYGKEVWLSNAKVTLGKNRLRLSADAIGREPLDVEDLVELKDLLEARWGRDVELNIGSRISL